MKYIVWRRNDFKGNTITIKNGIRLNNAKEDFKLEYNKKKKQYEGNVYLKQGYYNYHYDLQDISTNRIDVSFIEGTHYQTRNDYYIYVYYRSIGDRYDKFVGFLKTSSKELF